MERPLVWLAACALAIASGCGTSDGADKGLKSEGTDDDEKTEETGSDGDDDSKNEDDDSKNEDDDDSKNEDDDDDSKDDSSGGQQTEGSGKPKDAGTSGPAKDASKPATTTDAGGDEEPTPPASMGMNCLKGTGDFNGNGPYKVKKKDVTIDPQGAFTIFYPDPLESACPHPIVAWGNGTAVTGSDTYAFYQEHAASWGIVVVASHNDNVGSGAFHKAGIDYLLAQNKESGSEFFGKLSTRAGTSGHSQGGMGANVAASHPNVQAIGNVQGAFGAAPRGKAFLCLTGTEDIATQGCKTAVNGSQSPGLYANWEGGDHVGTATLLGFITGDQGTKQYMRLYTGWFRCFLADDSQACAMFKGGADCPVCKDSGWAEIFAKNY